MHQYFGKSTINNNQQQIIQMKKIPLALVAIALALSTGCTIVNKNDGGSSLKNPVVASETYVAKYDVSDKQVQVEDNVNVLFGFIAWGSKANHVADNYAGANQSAFSFLPSATELAKNKAYAYACEENNADAIVGAHYKLTTLDLFVFKQIKTELKGYPANLKGLEKKNFDDVTFSSTSAE